MIDKWNGLAVLLANLIEKYAADLDIDSMPDPIHAERENEKRNIGENVHKNDIETNIAA